jgi:hypothetical protein
MSPRPPLESGKRDLWIDGRVFVVDQEVWAHVKFLADLLSKMSDRVARLSKRGRVS